jgi:pectate lyase
MRNYFVILLGVLLVFLGVNVSSQTIAFPGAEGYGKNTTGGRGGKVIYVTNLNDEGKGSLRAAIKDSSKRIIIFKVSGTIFLAKTLEIKYGNVTIAGQTAPGDGICLAGYPLSIEGNNIIIRFLRFRMGDINKVQSDAIGAKGCNNVIIDHCSMSWSVDECASFYLNKNFTLQWCMVTESLYKSVHKKGSHGFGGIWGGSNVTFHHNLLAHHTSRNPRLNGTRLGETETDRVDLRNNVIYNWGYNSTYGGEAGQYNIVANYYKPGPATNVKRTNRIVEITNSDKLDYGVFYIDDNIVDKNPNVSADNWNGGVDTKADISKVKALKEFPYEPIKQQKADEAYVSVLKSAGASLKRDTIDTRIIKEVKNGTAQYGATYESGGKGIIDSQKEVGGWPELKSLPAPTDTDFDGMPDEWENSNKLDPANPNDGGIISNDNRYTNLEIYLNSLVKDIIN